MGIRFSKLTRCQLGLSGVLASAAVGCSGDVSSTSAPNLVPGQAIPGIQTPAQTIPGSQIPGSQVVVPVTPGTQEPAQAIAGASAIPGAQGSQAASSAAPGVDPRPVANCALNFDVGETPLTRLSSREVQNSLQDLFGLDDVNIEAISDADEAGGTFVQNISAPVSEPVVGKYAGFAEEIAARVVEKIDDLVSCNSGEACASEFVETYAPLMYRRPLEAGEAEQLMTVFNAGRDFETGLRLVVETLVQAPLFLYRVEFGGTEVAPGILKISAHELASRLSFALHGTSPSRELFEAASNGLLDTPDQLSAQVDAMLADPKAVDTIGNFHTQWLNLSELERANKDTDLYPEFNDGMRGAMLREVSRFTSKVILEGDSRLETLMTAPYSYPERELFSVYGLEDPGENYDANVPLMLDASQRSGILTLPGVMAATADDDQSSPIKRGVWIRENVLCDVLPSAPEGVDTTPPVADPNATTRERFAAHTEDPTCAGCHSLIDPIGLGFENYDAIGAFRAEENNVAIDASGSVVGLANSDFNGAPGLAQVLLRNDKLSNCMGEQWFRYILSRPQGSGDACTMDQVMAQFANSDFNIRGLIKSIVTSSTFQHVKGVQQ